MSIVRIDPVIDPRWRQLTGDRPTRVFSSPAWLAVLVETYGLDVRAFIQLDGGGKPSSGFSFSRIADAVGERIVSMPFSDYCDPIVTDAADWQQLSDAIVAENCPVIIRCLQNHLPLADPRFAVVKAARWHAVDVRPDLDALWRGLHDSSKRAIRKALRCGVTVRPASGEHELRAFHSMHVKLRKYKYGLLAQPYAFFASIWRQFVQKGRGELLLAIWQDRIVGGVMLLDWQNTAYYKFNASIAEELGQRPNDLLMWESIKYARQKNATSLDLGLSDWDQEGLIRYKMKVATEAGVISFAQHSPNADEVARQDAARAVLGRLTRSFTAASVPDDVSGAAGELLYRFLA